MDLKIITLEQEAFYELVTTVTQKVMAELKIVKEDKWISGDEAMEKLRIKSRTTLQKLRDEGRIRFTKIEHKLILYDSDSINTLLEKHAREAF